MTLPIYNIPESMNWVFFDLDDTLWDFSANSLDTLKTLYTAHEYLSEIFETFDHFSEKYHEINDRMWSLYQQGSIDSETVKRDRFRLLLIHDMNDNKAAQYAEILQHEYLTYLAGHTLLVEHSIDVLKRLSKKFQIGILSNGFLEVQYKKLYGSDLWKYVQRMILSDEIGVNKPNEKLFRYAEQSTGAIPEKTIMIGDNLQADIFGAINAGWEAVYFDRKGKCDAPEEIPVITSLEALLPPSL